MAKRKTVDTSARDIAEVAEFLETTCDCLLFTLKQEPISIFEKHLEELCDNYIETGTDFRRAYYIAKIIERGAEPEPIYVAACDPDLLIIKGCHRLVAFWILGMKFVSVIYVSKKR